ncbi:MAG TPA: hypothetical protein VMX54_11015 [Vicinamibacteria bacterium]|nr:hypothetical protein [Vicinamibacteria bacterium]
MRRLVDAVANEAERDDRLRAGLYATDLLQRILMPDEPEDASQDWPDAERGRLVTLEEGSGELWVDGRKTKARPAFAILAPAADPRAAEATLAVG